MVYEKVEEIMEKQLAEILPKFRPVFGNQKHIQLAQSIGKLHALEKEHKQKMESANGAQKIAEELSRIKRQVLAQLKEI